MILMAGSTRFLMAGSSGFEMDTRSPPFYGWAKVGRKYESLVFRRRGKKNPAGAIIASTEGRDDRCEGEGEGEGEGRQDGVRARQQPESGDESGTDNHDNGALPSTVVHLLIGPPINPLPVPVESRRPDL